MDWDILRWTFTIVAVLGYLEYRDYRHHNPN